MVLHQLSQVNMDVHIYIQVSQAINLSFWIELDPNNMFFLLLTGINYIINLIVYNVWTFLFASMQVSERQSSTKLGHQYLEALLRTMLVISLNKCVVMEIWCFLKYKQ